jgi:hypothetical protein
MNPVENVGEPENISNINQFVTVCNLRMFLVPISGNFHDLFSGACNCL